MALALHQKEGNGFYSGHERFVTERFTSHELIIQRGSDR